MTTTTVTVRHNFETGHRLPPLEGKCQNLHGHSWWAEVTVSAPAPSDGVVVEFGAFKKALRDWIDLNLDHGLMLGREDVLTPVLLQHGKVYIFGNDLFTKGLDWPTVENVAQLLGRVASSLLTDVPHAEGARVTSVIVRETHVNQAGWRDA